MFKIEPLTPDTPDVPAETLDEPYNLNDSVNVQQSGAGYVSPRYTPGSPNSKIKDYVDSPRYTPASPEFREFVQFSLNDVEPLTPRNKPATFVALVTEPETLVRKCYSCKKVLPEIPFLQYDPFECANDFCEDCVIKYCHRCWERAVLNEKYLCESCDAELKYLKNQISPPNSPKPDSPKPSMPNQTYQTVSNQTVSNQNVSNRSINEQTVPYQSPPDPSLPEPTIPLPCITPPYSLLPLPDFTPATPKKSKLPPKLKLKKTKKVKKLFKFSGKKLNFDKINSN